MGKCALNHKEESHLNHKEGSFAVTGLSASMTYEID